MQYRTNKQGEPISILGYGCMRFSKDKLGKTELDKTEREISAAIENGVNYFDTAYIYPGSEEALGEVLHRLQIRDKVQIATKLPHYLSKSIATMDKLFYEQLKRLKTDRVDYYLMHMLNDIGT